MANALLELLTMDAEACPAVRIDPTGQDHEGDIHAEPISPSLPSHLHVEHVSAPRPGGHRSPWSRRRRSAAGELEIRRCENGRRGGCYSTQDMSFPSNRI